MTSDFNRTVREFAAALMPIVMPAVRGLLGILLALGMLVGFLTLVCSPQIQRHSGYAEAWEAFLDGLEQYDVDSSKVTATGTYPRGTLVQITGEIDRTNEYGLKRTEAVSGRYDIETRQLTWLRIGREVVYEKERDGPLPE